MTENSSMAAIGQAGRPDLAQVGLEVIDGCSLVLLARDVSESDGIQSICYVRRF